MNEFANAKVARADARALFVTECDVPVPRGSRPTASPNVTPFARASMATTTLLVRYAEVADALDLENRPFEASLVRESATRVLA